MHRLSFFVGVGLGASLVLFWLLLITYGGNMRAWWAHLRGTPGSELTVAVGPPPVFTADVLSREAVEAWENEILWFVIFRHGDELYVQEYEGVATYRPAGNAWQLESYVPWARIEDLQPGLWEEKMGRYPPPRIYPFLITDPRLCCAEGH